jgi:hypothetical protein
MRTTIRVCVVFFCVSVGGSFGDLIYFTAHLQARIKIVIYDTLGCFIKKQYSAGMRIQSLY